MELQVRNFQDPNKVVNSTFSDEFLSADFNEALVHQVVVAYLAYARTGSSKQKTRSEVSGGGAKPWKQKGTGRARTGSIRNPIWRGGGVAFASRPTSFAQKVNKKMYRNAIKSILSEIIRKDGLIVVDELKLDSHKTKDFLKLMDTFALTNCLIVDENISENIYLSSRNLYNFSVCDFANINPLLLLKHEKVLVTKAALEKIIEVWQ